MKITTCFLIAFCCLAKAAVPTFQSFESTQFDTNLLSIKYRSDWTNELGVIRPATINTEVTLTNLNLYEAFVLPAKVVLLTLGTNELNVATNSTWLLYSPTNDAAEVTLSLSAGKYQGQLLFITSQNGDGAFTLPDESEQYDVPGALVDLQGNWIGTTNRGVILQYTAPDWIEMARFNPGLPAPEGFTIGAGLTNIGGVLSATGGGGDAIFVNTDGIIEPAGGQTATNRFSFTSGAADHSTNVAAVINSESEWQDADAQLLAIQSMYTNVFTFFPTSGGTLTVGRHQDSYGRNNHSFLSVRDASLDPTDINKIEAATINSSNGDYSSVAFLRTEIRYAQMRLETISPTNATPASEFNKLHLSSGDTDNLFISLSPEGTERTGLHPAVVSTGSAVAYLFDTPNVLTNGDSLFQVRNAGIDRVRFQHDGTLSIQNTTNRLGVVAGVLQLDGYNIGGSSSVITYTNQFVYNSKVTFNAPVYVTNTTLYIDNVDVRQIWQGASASDETTALTVTTNAVRFQLPFAMTLTSVYASLTTPQASGSTLTLDLKESGTSVLSTLLTLDNTEYGSDTATPAVISDSAIAKFAPLVFSITQVGTPPAGLKVWIGGIRLP